MVVDVLMKVDMVEEVHLVESPRVDRLPFESDG